MSKEMDNPDAMLTESMEHSDEVINEDSLLQLLHEEPVEISNTDSETSTSSGKWQLGAALSPQLSYRDVGSADVYQNTIVNNSESAKMTFSGGLQFSYKRSNRLTIESGIYYNRMGVNIRDYRSFQFGLFSREKYYSPISDDVVKISNSMGTIVSEDKSVFLNNYTNNVDALDYPVLSPAEMQVGNSTVNSFSQTFEYLEIPLNIRYRIVDKAVQVQVIGGLSTNLLLKTSISAITSNEKVKIGEVQDIRSVNYSGNLGIGFGYEIFSSFTLSIEPRFRYYLNSINQGGLPAIRPYAFGLHTGVNYTF